MWYLNVWTLELGLKDTFAREARHMEAIPMRVTNQNVTGIGDIDTVREGCDFLVADAVLELTVLAEHSNAMTFEVAHVEVGAWTSASEKSE